MWRRVESASSSTSSDLKWWALPKVNWYLSHIWFSKFSFYSIWIFSRHIWIFQDLSCMLEFF
jgi:hypothetical protein